MDQSKEKSDSLLELVILDQTGSVINDTSVKDVTSNLCGTQINNTLPIVSCDMANGTTEAESSDIAIRIGGSASTRSSNMAMVNWNNKEEYVLELGISELFEPQSTEVCEIG